MIAAPQTDADQGRVSKGTRSYAWRMHGFSAAREHFFSIADALACVSWVAANVPGVIKYTTSKASCCMLSA